MMGKQLYIWAGFIKGSPVCDRTMPSTCEQQAKKRVEDLKQRGKSDAFYTNYLIKPFWY